MAQWLGHSLGFQVHSYEDPSGPSVLCPHIVPMTVVNLLTWSTCIWGGGEAEEGVESRVQHRPDGVTLLLMS